MMVVGRQALYLYISCWNFIRKNVVRKKSTYRRSSFRSFYMPYVFLCISMQCQRSILQSKLTQKSKAVFSCWTKKYACQALAISHKEMFEDAATRLGNFQRAINILPNGDSSVLFCERVKRSPAENDVKKGVA